MDAATLHRVTSGNPFFVTEVLAAGQGEIPATVRDAVSARVARLSSAAQQTLRAASVLGQTFEPAVLREVAAAEPAAIDECVSRGMLRRDGELLRFRHELAQWVVRESRISGGVRSPCTGGALAALRRKDEIDHARLANHAVAAGDTAAVLEFGPEAARRAADLGAHREAAGHYAAVLRFTGELDERSRAELLERHARESLLIDDVDAALASQQEALGCWRHLEDVRAEGNCLRALSLISWFSGDATHAIDFAEQAVELLESVSAPSPELARAYATLAQRYLVGMLRRGCRALVECARPRACRARRGMSPPRFMRLRRAESRRSTRTGIWVGEAGGKLPTLGRRGTGRRRGARGDQSHRGRPGSEALRHRRYGIAPKRSNT